jgi:hypothetical protein
MNSEKEKIFIEIFGEENLAQFASQQVIVDTKVEKLKELSELRQRASDVFKVHLTFPDIAVSVSAGVLVGLGNALFKNFFHIKSIDKNGHINGKNTFGQYNHQHEVSNTIIDHRSPRLAGMDYENNLHRQLGPTHDLFRFKETLALLSGEKSDYDIWGKTATQIIGHPLAPLGQKFTDFLISGGFNIPSNPKQELLNHLLIDFFSKHSLPIPGTTWIADAGSKGQVSSLMLRIYDDGFNLKNTLGNSIGLALIEIVIRSYTFLFKAIPESGFSLSPLQLSEIKKLFTTYSALKSRNEFHVMMMISHGSSFLTDTLITTGSKSYMGLFQLNYPSLIAFSKYLLQYLLKNAAEYNKLIEQAKDKANEIADIDIVWSTNYWSNLQTTFSDPAFVSIFDADEWLRQSDIIAKFRDGTKERLLKEEELIRQLNSENNG